jgi:hypothetical protein
VGSMTIFRRARCAASPVAVRLLQPNLTGCVMAQTFSFMTKMRATSSTEEKKKLLTARQEVMKKLSPEERKKASRAAQRGMLAARVLIC